MKQILTFSLMIGVSLFATAQTSNLTVRLSSDTVNLATPFEIVFTVEGEQYGHFQQPEFLDFEVIYSNQSTQMNITNGAVKKSTSYTFGLRAKAAGSYVIEKASLTIDGETFTTDSMKVMVDENYVPKTIPKEEMDFWNPFGDFPKPEDLFSKPKPKKERKIYKI